MTKVKMTERGTILLPKEVRDRRGFLAGAEFEVVDGGRDIVLKPLKQAHQARPQEPKRRLTVDEFVARLPRIKEPLITDEMIDETIDKEARRMWDEENKR